MNFSIGSALERSFAILKLHKMEILKRNGLEKEDENMVKEWKGTGPKVK